jgi:hypothetical protein
VASWAGRRRRAWPPAWRRLAGALWRLEVLSRRGVGKERETGEDCGEVIPVRRHMRWQARLVVSMLSGTYLRQLDAYHARKDGLL